MKKLIIIFAFSISICLIIFIALYQNLVNIGSELEDEHCMKVNPIIIQRKNSYIRQMGAIMSSGSAELVQKELASYMDFSKKHVEAETDWLNRQKAYMNRLDYKMLIPSNIQKLSIAQYDSRYAEKNISQFLVDEMNTQDTTEQKAISDKVAMEKNRQVKADEEYNRLWDTPRSKWDLRIYLTKVPESKCPEENWNIPNVPDYFGINK